MRGRTRGRFAGNREAHHLDFLSIATRTRHRGGRSARGQRRRVRDLVTDVGLPRENGEFMGGEAVVFGHSMSSSGDLSGGLQVADRRGLRWNAVELRILGPLEVLDDDGAPVDIGGSRPRTLLIDLALAKGHPVPADQLLEDVWSGERIPARNNLQVHVSRLRRALGEERIATRGGGYALDLPRTRSTRPVSTGSRRKAARPSTRVKPRRPRRFCATRSHCGAAPHSSTSQTTPSRDRSSPDSKSRASPRSKTASTPTCCSAGTRS